jgi:hypothetical protein
MARQLAVGPGQLDGGTVFKLTLPSQGQTEWTETVLYSFCSLPNCSDGKAPLGSTLIADKQGVLYGTTSAGGGCWSWHSFQADAASQGPDRLDRDSALQFLLSAKLQ